MSEAPIIAWESRSEFESGCRALVRATSFAVGAGRCGAVSITSLVPDGFFQPIEGGGASATSLIGPGEATALAQALLDAAQEARRLGPPLYGSA